MTTKDTTCTTTTSLEAKKARANKTKKQPAAGGGFGAATTSTKKQGSSDDYAVFPALEPDVKTTLVASSSDSGNVADELPNEIYQRLAQIYGFPKFNYEAGSDHDDNKEEEEEEAGSSGGGGMMSMQDLISGNLEEDDEKDSNNKNAAFDRFQISKLPPFENFRVLHVDPLVLSVDNFFTPDESDAYVAMPNTDKSMFQTGSMTVGKDAKSKSQRTSTTWFSHYKNVPALMAKASRLLGLEGIDRWEEPQTVR